MTIKEIMKQLEGKSKRQIIKILKQEKKKIDDENYSQEKK